MIGYPPARRNASTLWKCPLGRENDGAAKATLAVTKADFHAALRQQPSLLQRLCTVYMQDFLCLSFPLPPECEGGHELDWAGAKSQAGAGTGRQRHAGTGAPPLG